VWVKQNAMPESTLDRPTRSHEFIFLLTKSAHYYFDGFPVREPAEWARWGDQTTPKYGNRPGLKGRSIQAKTMEELNLESRRTAGRNIRDVWQIPNQPYEGAHFAVFPEEIPRRCILAGCPEQVCRTCGKPRRRILDHEIHTVHKKSYSAADTGAVGRHRGGVEGRAGGFYEGSTESLGWTDCGHDAYRPGVVMDPFAGSGTTMFVARNHGRHSIGIELSEEYAREHIAPRLAQQSLFT
jgi:hypothetical protein